MRERFQKVGEWKKLASKLKEYENDVLGPRPTIATVLSIKKFSNFALYVINK